MEEIQKMDKKTVLLPMIGFILLATLACGVMTTQPDLLTPGAPSAETTSLPAEIPVEQETPLLNTKWLWTSLTENDPPSLSVVGDPENYLLVLYPEDIFVFTADCNQGSGQYLLDGDNLTLILGPVTLAACDPDSLFDQYIRLLGQVVNYKIQDGSLELGLANDVGKISFSNGGTAEPLQLTEAQKSAPAIEAESEPESALPAVAFTVNELPYAVNLVNVPATPYDNTQPPGPTGLPEHLRLDWTETETSADIAASTSLVIIPVAEYQQLWEEAGDPSVTGQLEALQKLLNDRPTPLPGMGLPALPTEMIGAGFNDIAVQGQYLDFPWGSGIRFIGRWSQDPAPVTNQGLSYVFQGFTSDGKYLVSFKIPVRTAGLPDTPEQASPDELTWVESDLPAYLQTRTIQLNALPLEAWEPDITLIDQALSSLTIQAGDQAAAVALPETAPTSEITETTWSWLELVDSTGEKIISAPLRQVYSLRLEPDGRALVQAGCNSLTGQYVLAGDSLNIQLDPTSLADCGPGSLSNEFKNWVSNVVKYQLLDDQLTLHFAQDGGGMVFTK